MYYIVGNSAFNVEALDNKRKAMFDSRGFVPISDEDYAQWVNANIVTIVTIPKSITPRQARLILLQMNLLDEVDSALAANREWQISWEYATFIERASPLITALATQLGLTDEQIDTMFVEAAKL